MSSPESFQDISTVETLTTQLRFAHDIQALEGMRRAINKASNDQSITPQEAAQLRVLHAERQAELLSPDIALIQSAKNLEEIGAVHRSIRDRLEQSTLPQAEFHALEHLVEKRIDELAGTPAPGITPASL